MQAYRLYHIRKKSTSSAHICGVAANHVQETDVQMMMVDALQILVNAMIEYK